MYTQVPTYTHTYATHTCMYSLTHACTLHMCTHTYICSYRIANMQTLCNIKYTVNLWSQLQS